MKKSLPLITLIVLLLGMATSASAQLLNENFSNSGLLTANGWTGHSGTGTNALTTTTGLTFTGYIGSGVGNAAFISNLSGEDANIGLSDSVYTNGKTVYTSFMINVTDTSANRTGDYFFHLGNRASSSVFSSFAARLFARTVNGNVNFGISNLSTAGTMKYSPVDYAKNTSYLVILKYTINTAGVDTVKLWVKSTGVPVSESAAGVPDAVADSSVQLGQDIIDALAVRQGSATTSVGVVVDGIRVDTSWTGALGILSTDKIYSIGTGNVPGEVEHYTSLKAACDSIQANAGNITDNRIYYITSDLTEAANVSVSGNTGGKTITFKPYTGITPTITFTQVADNAGLSGAWCIGIKNLTTSSTTNYGMTLNDSTQNFIIDGSNKAGGKTRDLTIKTAAGVHTNANPIRIFGNTNNITIKNVVVSTGQSVSYGILVTVRQTATAGYAGNYVPDNILIDNCDVTNTFGAAGQGIAISNSGTPTAFPTGVVISNNKVTAMTRGIFLNYIGNTDIYGNEIYINQTGTGSLSEGIFAFVVGSPTNVVNIYNNKLLQLATANILTGTGAGMFGIYLATNGIFNVYNNTITGFSFPNGFMGIAGGIGVATATINGITANIYNNSVCMANGLNTIGATAPIQAAFYMNVSGASGTRVVNSKNNIFATLRTDSSTQAAYVSTTNVGTLTADYNVLYSAGTKLAKYGATDCPTFADWKTASAQDANSKSGAVQYVSAADLHIKTTAYPVSAASNAGTPIVSVTTDIDGDMRNASTPDIGADEFTANPIVPVSGFTVSPKIYSFGNVWKDSTKIDSVTVTNNGNAAALVIDSVKSSNPLFTVTPSTANLDTNASKKFVITFSPLAKGVQSGNVIFYHNAPTAKDTLFVSGTGIIKEALFSSTPSSVNFRGVLVGKTKMDSVVVQNTGTDSLHITAVSSSDPVFTVTPTVAHINAAGSQKFYITFVPTAIVAKAASIVFTSNVSKGSDTVSVFGIGTKAVTIAEARKDTNNDFIPDHSISKDTLVVYGVITSPNFQSTQTSYFMQDSSGGINIFSYTLTSTKFVVGDSVYVIGTVAQYRGLTELTPLTVDSVNFGIIKHNAIVPKPKHLTLHQFVLNPENYEGQLIEVDTLYKATGTWPAAGAYASVYLTNVTKADTAQLFIDNDTNIDGTVEPEYPMNVVGIISQYSSASTVYNNGYEIMPRDTADINPPQPVVRMASTLTTSKIQTTVTNVGHIGGLNDFQDKVGVKFGGMERMFEGSFIFTTDSAHVSNAWRNRLGAYSSGFRPLKNIKISPVGTSIRTETMYDDSNQVRPLGIAVIEKTLVDTSAAKAGYLLVQLGVINKTNAKISKLRVGAFLDFDMTAAGTTDRGGIIRDSTNVITGVNGGNPFKMHVAYEQESGVNTAFLGIVPLSQGQLSGGRISSGAAEIYPTGVAFTDSIKNNFVSTFRATNMFTDNGKSDDQSIIASVGPYDINAKDTVRAAFAVISGSSLGDLIATARLAQRDYVAIGNAFGPVTKVNPEEIPLTFALDQNFPNPFNPTTMIRFALPKESKVSLKVYDVIGREVRTLVNGDLAAGINTVEWNGRNNLGQAVASGMYLYRIQAGTFVSTKKMMLLK